MNQSYVCTLIKNKNLLPTKKENAFILICSFNINYQNVENSVYKIIIDRYVLRKTMFAKNNILIQCYSENATQRQIGAFDATFSLVQNNYFNKIFRA